MSFLFVFAATAATNTAVITTTTTTSLQGPEYSPHYSPYTQCSGWDSSYKPCVIKTAKLELARVSQLIIGEARNQISNGRISSSSRFLLLLLLLLLFFLVLPPANLSSIGSKKGIKLMKSMVFIIHTIKLVLGGMTLFLQDYFQERWYHILLILEVRVMINLKRQINTRYQRSWGWLVA